MTFVCQLVLVCLNVTYLRQNTSQVLGILWQMSLFQIQRFKTLAPAFMDLMATKVPSHSTSTQLASIVHELLSASLKLSSAPTYRRTWKRFKEFQLGVFHSQIASLPIAPATLALFVAYLFANHYAISTINTYVSALGYYHRLAGLQDH